MSATATVTALIRSASSYYRDSGRFALHFARNKLRYDPAYRTILAQGLLEGRGRILDLGCGQGLLAAWLLAARAQHAEAAALWPQDWSFPPAPEAYRGIDLDSREVARARNALNGSTGIAVNLEHADIRSADYAQADAVVLLDVLHYLSRAAQEQVLQRAHAALAPRGLLLLRVGDATGGIGHRYGRAVDQTVGLLRHGRWTELACRALADWEELLGRCGFASRAVPHGGRAGFVNVLLRAQAA
jgi:SAM-dependent methyltransferase